MRFLVYIKTKYRMAVLACAICAVFLLSGWLSGMEPGAMLYCVLLWAAVCAVALAVGYNRFCRRLRALEDAGKSILFSQDTLPEPTDPVEEKYQELLDIVLRDREALRTESNRRNREQTDIFTLWAHQIKNPIAAMRLILQQEQHLDGGELEQELFKIEQYVQMALNVLRLDSESTDFVLRRCRLDDIIRPAVKKYAGQFIRKRIRLEYEGTALTVLTDEKWLAFVIEQLISNALKYTSRGCISITTGENCLRIKDSGIGIAPEDLPRVFEKGYTGYNGREDKKSTGIGLWLCKRILKELGHEISIESVPGEGTEVTVAFGEDHTGPME